jgi:hypothetical protein
MKYYGIKTPENYIWWITDSEHNSWFAFFTWQNKDGQYNPHRAPLYTAIEAYKSIGYRCVELEVREKTE